MGKENVGDKSKEKDEDNGGAALNIWVRSLKPNAEERGILTTGFKAEKKIREAAWQQHVKWAEGKRTKEGDEKIAAFGERWIGKACFLTEMWTESRATS